MLHEIDHTAAIASYFSVCKKKESHVIPGHQQCSINMIGVCIGFRIVHFCPARKIGKEFVNILRFKLEFKE